MPQFLTTTTITEAGIPLHLHVTAVIDELMSTEAAYRGPTTAEQKIIQQCVNQLEVDLHSLTLDPKETKTGMDLMAWTVLVYPKCRYRQYSKGWPEITTSDLVETEDIERNKKIVYDWLADMIERLKVYLSQESLKWETNQRWVIIASFIKRCYSQANFYRQANNRGHVTPLEKHSLITNVDDFGFHPQEGRFVPIAQVPENGFKTS